MTTVNKGAETSGAVASLPNKSPKDCRKLNNSLELNDRARIVMFNTGVILGEFAVESSLHKELFQVSVPGPNTTTVLKLPDGIEIRGLKSYIATQMLDVKDDGTKCFGNTFEKSSFEVKSAVRVDPVRTRDPSEAIQ